MSYDTWLRFRRPRDILSPSVRLVLLVVLLAKPCNLTPQVSSTSSAAVLLAFDGNATPIASDPATSIAAVSETMPQQLVSPPQESSANQLSVPRKPLPLVRSAAVAIGEAPPQQLGTALLPAAHYFASNLYVQATSVPNITDAEARRLCGFGASMGPNGCQPAAWVVLILSAVVVVGVITIVCWWRRKGCANDKKENEEKKFKKGGGGGGASSSSGGSPSSLRAAESGSAPAATEHPAGSSDAREWLDQRMMLAELEKSGALTGEQVEEQKRNLLTTV